MNEKILVIDTETINIDKPYIYDLGLVVAQDNGKGEYLPIIENAFVIRQVYDNKPLFNTAYYRNKKPLYTQKMRQKKAIKKYLGHTMRYIESIIKQHKITKVFAFNSPFDKRAINYTTDFFKTRNLFEKLEWYDIQAIANKYIHQTYDYRVFAKNNGYVTPKGNLKGNVEITYQFITNNKHFREDHMGLQDAIIELQILNHCFKRGYQFTQEKRQFIKA